MDKGKILGDFGKNLGERKFITLVFKMITVRKVEGEG